jgi:hypothetical protein
MLTSIEAIVPASPRVPRVAGAAGSWVTGRLSGTVDVV